MEPIGFRLLPGKLTLTQLQKLYESVLGGPVDTRNFCKRVLAMELVTPYESLKRKGFQFEL
jgi:8-oxo-dGTP diphosphatase